MYCNRGGPVLNQLSLSVYSNKTRLLDSLTLNRLSMFQSCFINDCIELISISLHNLITYFVSLLMILDTDFLL